MPQTLFQVVDFHSFNSITEPRHLDNAEDMDKSKRGAKKPHRLNPKF